ncbi:B12-binding domain-containing radical SAM protein [Fervidobacterium thailandense]|uniref:B12-binding domain-containing radical SAM protein n=1 Tax=Fervidobacterium thailandense TaxID=1008305 RepID=UPI001F4EB988|nr:radical SAM protein [Fervidobacterium thailandense]
MERFFYEPWFKKFYSMESQRPIDEFPIWMFTFQFENDLLNIANLLIRKKIPLRASDREEFHPIIFIGGPVTLFNPRIVSEIADVVYVGDFECAVSRVAAVIKEFQRIGRTNVIEELAKLDQVLSKVAGKESFKSCISPLEDVPVAHYTTPYSVFKNKLLIEVGRGCIRRCAFCVTGYTKKPVKFANVNRVREVLLKHRDREFGLISATITDYPYLDELLETIESEGIKFSVSSLRVDGVTERLLKLLKETEHYSFTIAPEGISQKMRDVMLKDLNTAEILSGLKLARDVGFYNVKMYFIIGLEEETEDDYRELFDLLSETLRMGYRRITLSVNPLVPKPCTPFYERSMISKKEYEERLKYIKKNVPKDVLLEAESYKECYLQYQISKLKDEETLEFLKEHLDKTER